MSDLRLKYDVDTQDFDLGIKNNDLEFDDGLETSILISLFSDARVEEEELSEEHGARRGWWADAVDNEDNVQTGSKLWLLAREKRTDETLERAREYCLEALRWLITDGVASDVEVTPTWLDNKTMQIIIEVTRPTGSESITFKFDYVWLARDL